jgi:hypothetical protein
MASSFCIGVIRNGVFMRPIYAARTDLCAFHVRRRKLRALHVSAILREPPRGRSYQDVYPKASLQLQIGSVCFTLREQFDAYLAGPGRELPTVAGILYSPRSSSHKAVSLTCTTWYSPRPVIPAYFPVPPVNSKVPRNSFGFASFRTYLAKTLDHRPL